jgi:hypothetical protein
MKPVLHSLPNQKGYKKERENYRIISLINIVSKILIKYWETESNSLSQRSYTMIKLVLPYRCRDGSIYTNH